MTFRIFDGSALVLYVRLVGLDLSEADQTFEEGLGALTAGDGSTKGLVG